MNGPLSFDEWNFSGGDTQGSFALGIIIMSSEKGCILTNVTVRTLQQKKHIVVVKCGRTLKPYLL